MTHNITRLTLAQLLTSEDRTIYRNAMSILKVLRECDHNFDGSARCIYCLREQPYRPAQWCGTCDLPTDQCKHDHD